MATDLMRNYFFIGDIDENDNYVFVQLFFNRVNYTGFIDKKSNEIKFCEEGNSEIYGIKDDINNLMEVSPMQITSKNEIIYLIQPSQLFKWFDENPEEAALAKAKLNWLKDINELSNPIIAIAECK